VVVDRGDLRGAAGVSEAQEQLRALTAAHGEVLEAVLETLIPADEHGPGAREARVLRYVDGALAAELRAELPFYENGIEATDAWARARHGRGFAELDEAGRAGVLSEIQDGTAEGFEPSSAAFFMGLRELALQGMFGDPRHGGNEGYAGWELLGYPGPRWVVTQEEQMMDVVVEPEYRRG
jgi:gluconate 2-dehydrogenase gamma chain